MAASARLDMLKYVLASLIVGGAAGFIPTYLQLRDARNELAAVEERLNADLATAREDLLVSDIHSRVAILASHVREGDFETARRLSTQLYDEVDQALLVVAGDDAKRRLTTLSRTRDQITAALALSDPKALETLERLFTLLGGSI